MAVHIFRREATYYWRRRTPIALATYFDRPHLLMSLRTTSPAIARRLAARLDTIVEDAAMLAENDLQLSKAQLEAMLAAVVDRHLAKLERVAAAAKSSLSFDIEQARADDKRALWAYTLLDARGFTAVVRPEDRAQMAAAELSEADIDAVQDHLAMLRINELVPTRTHILEKLIEGAKGHPNAMNMAQGIYFRGIKLALAQMERRYGASRVEDDGFVERMLRSLGMVPLAEQPSPPNHTASVAPAVGVASPDKTSPAQTPLPVSELLKFAEGIIKAKAADENWDEKTQR